MNPIEFKEQTNVMGKNQEDYKPLPVCITEYESANKDVPDHLKVHRFTSKWEFTDLELEQIKKTRCIFLTQYGTICHPLIPQVETPFGYCTVEYQKGDFNDYDVWIPLTDGTTLHLENIFKTDVIGTILKNVPNVSAEQIFFVERKGMSVSEKGLNTEL
jgi:hypothetical protein